MLLSPGHSPRQISTPSPPPSQSEPQSQSQSQSKLLITPEAEHPSSSQNLRKRIRSAAILDEDTYVNAIEKIIERDFFPDIPKLRDRLDWLEAVRSRDPVVIRDVQLKILDRRASKSVGPNKTPSTSTRAETKTQTPASNFRFNPSATPFDPERTPSFSVRGDLDGEKGTIFEESDGGVDISVPLDEFFRMYTSEDNESFDKIMEKVNRKRREKYSHLLERDGENPALEDGVVDEKDRITDGYGTSNQPVSSLEGWKYSAKNLLMYNAGEQADVPLTEGEIAERMKGLTKVINRSNTRFHGKTDSEAAGDNKVEEGDAKILYKMVPGTTPAGASWPFADRDSERSRRYDLEDLKKTPDLYYVESDKKADNGYRFVKTPSPAPGAGGESPFMTWGEIDGTPLRLDREDTPVDIGGTGIGPHFSIAFPPSRDVKAHSLSRDAAKKMRERAHKYQKPPLPSMSPRPRSKSMSPIVRTLSPAAQKFVRNAIAKSSHSVDETLRASYRKSPSATPNRHLSPTPKAHLSSTRFGKEASLMESRSPSAPTDTKI